MKLLVIEGGIHGRTRNCGKIIPVINGLSSFGEHEYIFLSEGSPLERVVCEADAYLFITGTYWDSCGSPMQKFLEDFTHLECDSRIIGKPVAVIVLCHTVGGKTVLSRLQGVLSCMGFLIPPLTGVVISRDSVVSEHNDSWDYADVDTVLKNLYTACSFSRSKWTKWPIDKEDIEKVWVDTEIEDSPSEESTVGTEMRGVLCKSCNKPFVAFKSDTLWLKLCPHCGNDNKDMIMQN